jgi:hypothetical protein
MQSPIVYDEELLTAEFKHVEPGYVKYVAM